MGDMGDCMMLDFDRACPGGGPGEGVPPSFPNGLLRHLGPPWACMLILNVLQCSSSIRCYARVVSRALGRSGVHEISILLHSELDSVSLEYVQLNSVARRRKRVVVWSSVRRSRSPAGRQCLHRPNFASYAETRACALRLAPAAAGSSLLPNLKSSSSSTSMLSKLYMYGPWNITHMRRGYARRVCNPPAAATRASQPCE